MKFLLDINFQGTNQNHAFLRPSKEYVGNMQAAAVLRQMANSIAEGKPVEVDVNIRLLSDPFMVLSLKGGPE